MLLYIFFAYGVDYIFANITEFIATIDNNQTNEYSYLKGSFIIFCIITLSRYHTPRTASFLI